MVPPRKIAVTHGAPRSSPGSLLLPHRMGLLAGDLLPSHPQVTSSIPRCCHTLSHSSACPRPYGQIDLFGSLKLGFVVFNKSMKLNFLREEFIWSAALKKGHMASSSELDHWNARNLSGDSDQSQLDPIWNEDLKLSIP
ncbi:hypothetical protein OsI_16322 [Oryza sativa Indica Group]|uniref:Uncharacterized protein n=2 Tax=Oryza sativa TaxID=4530 RepID=B9FFQ8_ORYSJ|nr:hypothetical protein OsI_16322 [Oryza sativa Indica Group]EEE61192.1 hypothetical protein OsJ_15193 [Oryza sativa Japonica Group]